MSHAGISLLLPSPAHLAICPYLDRCTRTLAADGCASCRHNAAGFDPEGHLPDPAASLHLVAIDLAEAAR